MSYKDTLNLPQTDFAMKANLPQREPKMLEHWQKIDLYQKIREKFSGREQFILHDGPPYANGEIHLGHALNKVLKDIIIKSKTLSGFDAPYVPGWDCHGLPIEINVEKKVGKAGAKITPKAFRQACREYAPKQIAGQKNDFMRLGVLGEWDKPYLTMDFKFEANIIRTLGKMIANNHVYRGLKPVNWCSDCGSALAEAEVEYADKQSPAIDVRFAFVDQAAVLKVFAVDEKSAEQNSPQISTAIWTTTPWTLPANLAVSLHPQVNYSLVECEPQPQFSGSKEEGAANTENSKAPSLGKLRLIIAEDLLSDVMQRYGCDDYKILGTCQGAALENQLLAHPWLDRQVPIILGDHVTTESGTGAVHTAPGHGVDDYIVGQAYGLDVLNPVNGHGVFVDDVEYFAGQYVFKANKAVIDLLKEKSCLLAHKNIEHSYPHCWRHKTPIIFRATPQWFVGMKQNNLLEQALQEIKKVSWLPERGQARISSMMSGRPDWCISRQRSWGVPITVFYHKTSGEIHPRSLELLESVATQVEEQGVDAWFDLEAHTLLGDEANDYEKANDILDVWFDSGASHACVLEARDYLSSPADLYLEGSDQHRGWFQSSLLIGTAINQRAPYKAVLTHGFTVDSAGKKMSKSARNGVAPQKLMQQLGADVIRLWVASTDYRDDVAVSDEIFKRTADTYRRIRNTARFLLSNLDGFSASQDQLAFADLLALDQWAVSRCAQLQAEIIAAYDSYQFHLVYQKVQHFCAQELGGFYLSIVKDRVYTMPAQSVGRRSAQTAMFHIAQALVRWIAPITSFTADEIWQSLEKTDAEKDIESVHLVEWYDQLESLSDAAPMNHAYWENVQAIKDVINKKVEEARSAGLIKSELSTKINVYCAGQTKKYLADLGAELKFVLLTSKVSVLDLDQAPAEAQDTELSDLKIQINVSQEEKCTRCWHHDASVGQSSEHPELCSRCITNIQDQGESRHYA